MKKTGSVREDLVREAIRDLAPYEPGKPIEEVERELGLKEVVKLASNENALGPSPRAIEAIRRDAFKAHLYPDGGASLLKKRLAEHLGVDEGNLVLGNGSDEIIGMIGEAFVNPGDEAVMGDPAFIIYRMSVTIMAGKCRLVPLRNYTHDLPAMAGEINERTRVVFIANPNNPTGTMVTRDEMDRLMDKLRDDIIVVSDEAYYEYVERDDFPSTLEYVRQGRAVITLRTFSKIYGLAGLRIGYGISRPDLVKGMNRVRHPFNTSRIAQAAAVAALEDFEHVEKSRAMTRSGKRRLTEGLRALGLEVVPSEANFVLVRVGKDGSDVFNRLLLRGVIVRPMGFYGLREFVRVTVGKPEENEKFLSALAEVLKEC